MSTPPPSAPPAAPSPSGADLVLRAADPAHPSLAWLRLNRPAARNAWTPEMIAAFLAHIDALDEDDSVRAVLLTGEGPAFSAGGDLRAMAEHSGMFAGGPVALRGRYSRGIQEIPRRLARFDKPLIAVINGPAVGAGLDLACMCDLRFAASTARLGSTFVTLGLVPGDGGAALLARTVGLPHALDLVLTGRLIDADEALRIGLVHAVHPPEELAAAAVARALLIAHNAPLAVRLTKAAAMRSWGLPLDHALELAATYQGVVQNTADHDEGVRALLERRPPRFEGR